MRKVQANPFGRQWSDTRADVLSAVDRVGESGWYVLGSEVSAFEAALAAHQQARFAVGCASGLDAIELGLRALGLRPGDKVLTTPLSAFATTLAILRAGGEPVFVDVDECGALDLGLARSALTQDRSIRFAVPVHLFGFCMDLDGLAQLKADFGLRLVEDCAQAIGAGDGRRKVGKVGDVATYSFYPTKNLGALGDGGATSTDDEALAAALRCLRDYGQSAKYQHAEVGLNSRLDELHAAVLRSAYLPRLTAWTARRLSIAERYTAGLEQPLVAPLPARSGGEHVFHLYPVRVEGGQRDALLQHLRAAGIEAGIHYPCLITDQPALEKACPGLRLPPLPVATDLCAQELSLPIHPYLELDEIDFVIETVNRWRP